MAAAASARKPQPASGESDNPLSLDDDEPPAKTRPTATARKAPTASKGDKSEKSAKSGKKRRGPARRLGRGRDSHRQGAINPFWLLGGLSVLAVGVLAIGLFALMRSVDKKAEEEAARGRATRVEPNGS